MTSPADGLDRYPVATSLFGLDREDRMWVRFYVDALRGAGFPNHVGHAVAVGLAGADWWPDRDALVPLVEVGAVRVRLFDPATRARQALLDP